MLGDMTSTHNLCSDAYLHGDPEPLPGTAKQESVYVLFEQPGRWSHDIMDGHTFGEELTAQLKAKMKGQAGLQLIRLPGREGRDVGKLHRCYLVWAKEQVMELLLLDKPEDMLDLDLTGPGRNGGEPVDTPLVLVCTHAKRDQCCAIKGRPLAAALNEEFPGKMVWEASHMKGHRFAPTLLLMPWAYSFGRLNEEAARQMTRAALRGEMFVPANRGSGLLPPRGQVAELAVAATLTGLHYGELEVVDPGEGAVTVRHPDGRAWRVTLTQREVHGIVSSCGDEPKTSQAWAADSVETL